jgi:A/G-specific adenine glycosylase
MLFYNTLTSWYSENKRDLPWRNTTNPYIIWVSEIILQQTRVEQGTPYFFKFLEKYTTVQDFAKAEEQEILNLWQGLGYYSRARNMHFTAKHISNNLNAKFPSTFKDLLELKGVGEYTAAAIASFCYEEKVPVVDGNVYRFLARYFNIDIPINTSKSKKYFFELALELMDEAKPSDFNQALMDFGSQICKPQNPLCNQCPFSQQCEALKLNKIKELPVKQKKQKSRKRYFNFLILENDSKQVLEKRLEKDIWQNMYQYPLIETKEEISHQELINTKELKEWVKLAENEQFEELSKTKHILSHQIIYATFWKLKTNNYIQLLNSRGMWVNESEFSEYPVPRLIDKFLESNT